MLFLDEPTTGVDPVSRKEFWQMLKRLQQKGITILVSTPYMDEASLCDRIALIQKGKVLKIDTPQAITDNYEKVIYDIQSKNTHGLIHDLKNYPSHYSVYAFGEFIHYIDKNVDFSPIDLKTYLENKKHSEIIIKKSNNNHRRRFYGRIILLQLRITNYEERDTVTYCNKLPTTMNHQETPNIDQNLAPFLWRDWRRRKSYKLKTLPKNLAISQQLKASHLMFIKEKFLGFLGANGAGKNDGNENAYRNFKSNFWQRHCSRFRCSHSSGFG